MAEAARSAGYRSGRDGGLEFQYRLEAPLFDHQGMIVKAVLGHETTTAVRDIYAGPHALLRVLGLDPVAQPVRAGRGARFPAQRLGEPSGVGGLVVGGELVAVAEVLGQVLGQVADASVSVLRSGEHALGIEPGPEPRDVQRLVGVADGIKAAALRGTAARTRRAPRLGRPSGGRACAMLLAMIDDFAKEHLHDHLRWVRESLVWKLDGLSEYDIRRPLTATGTNLLGLVKHIAIWESRYFGLVFNRPFPEPLPQWDDEAAKGTDFWATEHETRDEIVGLYRRVWAHTDETINALAIDAPGYVPWWRDEVKLFNIMVHILSDTTRHAGTPTSCASSSTVQSG